MLRDLEAVACYWNWCILTDAERSAHQTGDAPSVAAGRLHCSRTQRCSLLGNHVP